MNKFIDAIKVLILVNVVLFAIRYLFPDMEAQMNSLALYFPANEHFNYWQLVTSMFMHGGVAHLLLNMYALWAFGTPLETMWGKNKFLFFYFMSGIGANLIYLGVNYFQFHSIYNELLSAGVSAENIQAILNTGSYDTSAVQTITMQQLTHFYHLYHTPAVGASGAIYGVLVAFGMAFPNAKLALIFFPVPIAAKYFIPLLITIDLFSGITGFSIFGGGIAHFAHVGGAAVGFLIILLWRKKQAAPQVQQDNY
ncbi:MAG: rhomboid family intramembrane serine protease [Chryseolinea sp.]